MRKLLIVTALLLFAGIAFSQDKADLERNKKVATIYHELKAENVDAILTEDFIGRNEKGRHTWNREDHRNYLSNGNYKKDVILNQVAEGDWVATRFERTMDWNGRRVTGEMMQFKRFENGKIAEIWEYGDPGQVETEEE
jgi:predicted SnoaL-like aldol condensation-catalyzing enzyme